MCLRLMTLVLSIAMLFCIVSGASQDKLSLIEFKANIVEDGPIGLFQEWNESKHFCSWPGVKCSRRHRERVTLLDLSSWLVKGQLSPHIGNLSFLRVLNISNNNFGGEIPKEIGRLFRLRMLDFADNTFAGEIPKNISGCSRLRILRMTRNELSGKIPAELGYLSDLIFLGLTANRIVGEIPASLGNLSQLVVVGLSENDLSGNIPASLGRLRNLKRFSIGSNDIEGHIPLSLYNVSTLEFLNVEVNRLEGNLPPELGNKLPSLETFDLSNNKFSGSIPASMSNASNLIHFDISANNFTGKFPSFKSSSNLEWLEMGKNNLGFAKTGDLNFLRDAMNFTRLESLAISINNFGGTIPETIGNATSLRKMIFGGNRITGNIPLGIGDLVSLEVLALESNNLIGQIPSSIGRLTKMQILSLWSNKLSGRIPTTIGNLTSLSKLLMSGNSIQGSIPTSIGRCIKLQALTLHSNNVSGSIPSQLASLSSLTIELGLSRNRLSGSIPIEIGKLVNLGLLDVSYNELSGEIPKALSRCRSLEYLRLQGNLLHGSIPEDLNELKGIREIDLSRNNLSGQIPIYLAEIQGLMNLNLSFNELVGPVPLKGVFNNASEFSVAGNNRLCGGLIELKLPKCVTKNQSPHRKTILIAIACCVVVGLGVVMISVKLVFLRIKTRKPGVESSAGISLPRVTYGDLFQATNSFSSSNLIGFGSSGSVYKGILNPENQLVAVKVLNLQVSRVLNSFVAECESLGRIRHRNLVKLRTVCSSIDYQGNDFKALVYEYMENGNLEEWLHSEKRLSLVRRVEIGINVAVAINYLHNQCFEPIIHCDIKPSNILLDDDMVAHLGDFGLAKLFQGSVSIQSSSVGVIRGTVGYVPPEYATGIEVSTLGDIYSFGVLLLEMFTAKRPTDNMFKDDFDLNNFASLAIHDSVTAIVDPMLLEEEQNLDEDSLKSCLVLLIEIGIACSSKHPAERRNIGDVVADLNKIKDKLVPRTTQNRA